MVNWTARVSPEAPHRRLCGPLAASRMVELSSFIIKVGPREEIDCSFDLLAELPQKLTTINDRKLNFSLACRTRNRVTIVVDIACRSRKTESTIVFDIACRTRKTESRQTLSSYIGLIRPASSMLRGTASMVHSGILAVDDDNPLGLADCEGTAASGVGVTRRSVQASLLDLIGVVGNIFA